MERRIRLREEADFRRVRSRGRAWGNQWLTLLVLANDLPHNRYGFVVSKRVGKATTRNLVKRRLRETLRQFDRARRIPRGYDLAFIVRPLLATATFPEVQRAVVELLTRARCYLPPATAEEVDPAPAPAALVAGEMRER